MLPTKKVHIAPVTVECRADQPFFLSNQIFGSGATPSFGVKAEAGASTNFLLNPVQIKTPTQNPVSTKDTPSLVFDALSSSQLLLSNLMFRDQSQKVLLQTVNYSLYQKLNILLSERTALLDCIKKREEKQANAFSISGPQERETKKKRQRRLANQIIRLYNCPESKCKKSYGSEFSLTQHLKSKHPERVEDLLGQMKQKLKTDPSA